MGSVRDSGRSQIWGGDGLRRRQRRPGWHLVAFPNGGSDSPGDGAMIQWRGRAGSAAIDSGGDRKARTGDLALGNNSNEMDMKRAAPWEQSHDISSDDSLSSDSEDDAKKKKDNTFGLPNSSKGAVAEAAPKKKKPGGVDFDALSRHGYRGGPSVLKVPPPKVEPDWTWSTGKDRNDRDDYPESHEERERTRAAVVEGEKLIGVQVNTQSSYMEEKDKKNASFAQKEKRKRDRGQASRGKNYVEEEKRHLRGSGIYSGFDT